MNDDLRRKDRFVRRLREAIGRSLTPFGVAAFLILLGSSQSTVLTAPRGPPVQVYFPFIASDGPLAATGTPTPTGTPSSTATTAVQTPTPTATPTAVSLGGASRLGIWVGPASSTSIAALQSAGARWTRLSLSWATIQPTLTSPARYDFSSYDRELAAIAAAGIQPIVEIRDSPPWAASTFCGPIDRAGGLKAFSNFLIALVQHYHRPPYNVENWELYNEPDGLTVQAALLYGINCFGTNSATEAGYVALLQTAYPAIKATDPHATVLLGGLADEDIYQQFNPSFLDQILALTPAADQYFDVANVHYFSTQAPTWAAYGNDIAGKVGAIRQVLANHGVSKPVAVTELSWTFRPYVQAQQTSYVAKVLSRGLNLDLYAMIWFSLADWSGADYPYGLLELNLSPKPAYTAFQVAAAEFGSASSVQPLAPGAVGVTSGIEGYVFIVGGQTRWVLWASPDGSHVQISIPAGATQAKDELGAAIPLAGSGLSTTYLLTDSPIFVEF